MTKAVKAFGIESPFIREGDDVASIIVKSVLRSGNAVEDKDIIGITESVVARAQGNYVTVNAVATEIIQKFGTHATLMLYNPIYSRNRFSIILRAFARACDRLIITMPYHDEVGNVVRNHPFTGLDYRQLYKDICKEERCECIVCEDLRGETEDSFTGWRNNHNNIKIDAYVDCTLHNNGFSTLSLHSWYRFYPLYTLMDFCSDKCEWGLLGSNKVNDEKLKLFPSKGGAQAVCDMVKTQFKELLGVDVVVCVYGDGAFKSPAYKGVSVWEYADPVSILAETEKELFDSCPSELKLKELIDNKTDEEIHKALSENASKSESSMGTTPRMRRDLIASLCDLITGSGDRATPCVHIKNYF